MFLHDPSERKYHGKKLGTRSDKTPNHQERGDVCKTYEKNLWEKLWERNMCESLQINNVEVNAVFDAALKF